MNEEDDSQDEQVNQDSQDEQVSINQGLGR